MVRYAVQSLSVVTRRLHTLQPILEYMLALAREEGPGNKELNDLMRIDIPFSKPIFFVFKVYPQHIRTRRFYVGAVLLCK